MDSDLGLFIQDLRPPRNPSNVDKKNPASRLSVEEKQHTSSKYTKQETASNKGKAATSSVQIRSQSKQGCPSCIFVPEGFLTSFAHCNDVVSSDSSFATSLKLYLSDSNIPSGASNTVFTCRSRSNKNQNGWCFGVVKGQPSDGVIYVKPAIKLPQQFIANKDVYIRKDRISGCSSLLAAKDGDKIEFLLSTKPMSSEKTTKGIKPSAYKANMLSFCAQRSYEELKLFFTLAKDKVSETSTRSEAMNSIMMCDAIWFYIFNAKCNDTAVHQMFMSEALELVFLLANYMESFPSRRREIIGLIVDKDFIENLNVQDKVSMGLRFAKLAVTLEPALLKKVMPLLSNLVKCSGSDLASGLYEMLLKVGNVSDLSNWHDLSQIPTIEELFGDPLEQVTFLKPVLLSSGYKNSDDYLNVYYRLLRTECFSAIQKGISDLKSGKLDARDMSVYEKVSVRDIDMEHSSILISLQFSLEKPVRNWKKSKKLMFGNLLCITIKGDFSDPIWLTVADRDVNILQKHNVIGVQLISFDGSDADAANIIRKLMLQSGKMIMAESPTYFQSFQHVLTSLKSSEISQFSLVNEIVHGNLSKSANCCSLIAPYLTNVGYKDLEKNQDKAFLHALESTLGIIQGPPGTGKTYVGSKLAHMFLCLQDGGTLNNLLEVNGSTEDGELGTSDMSLKNPPILILTYKNHALDEFLKHCTEFCDKEHITRIGSQSKEDTLKDCLLHNKMKNAKIRRMPTGPVIEQIKELFLKLSSSFSKLEKSKVFTFVSFISRLNFEQLIDFIDYAIKTPWKYRPKTVNIFEMTTKAMLLFFANWKEKDDFKENFLRLASQPDVNSNPGNVKERKGITIAQKEITIAQKIKDAYENHWLPNKQNLASLTQLQQRGAAFFNTHLIDNTEDEDDYIDEIVTDALGEDIDDLDEDYINEQLSMRVSAFDEDHTGNYRPLDIKSKKMAKLEAIFKGSVDHSKNKKIIFCLTDFPPNCTVSQGILRKNDLWTLSDIEKYTFIYSFLHSGCNDLMDEMNDLLENINILQKQKEVIDHNNKLKVLETQKIVGATIIGASVQLSLIKKLAPKVVIVEEAAEVLESCLVAVLSKSVQKLILIGDHMQLKPQVDTYHLRREHNFHVSMMERLIKIGFPYEKLLRQGRMRPEFSCMLKDIYPEYQDFPGLEAKRKTIMCLPHSMFFWSHQFPENKDRSVKNSSEANMVVALALFFIASGVDEARVTILCAYLGQVQLVRKLYREMNPLLPSRDQTKQLIDIRTIDEYQGDENDFVIISLTRSNSYGKIGFLNEIERRCVAQSRSKCGMYFVGNASMFRKSKTWKIVMDTMGGHNLISDRLPITCYRHLDNVYNVYQRENITKKGVVDDSQLMYYVKNNNNWCKVICNSSFPCGIEAHRCKKQCTPRHDDSRCLTKVDFTFLVCHHTTKKECYIEEKDMKCKTKRLVLLPKCGHQKEVECFIWTSERDRIVCMETCSQLYECPNEHKCENICGRDHAHFAEECPTQVEFELLICKHTAHFKKVCGKPIPKNVKCKTNIQYKRTECGHLQSRKCSDVEKCMHVCNKERTDCGHPCTNICSKPCLEIDCKICSEKYKESLDSAQKIAEEQLKICRLSEAKPDFFKLLHMSTSEMVDIMEIKEKCNVFFSLYSKSSVKEVVDVWKVQCPSNLTNFWERTSKAHGIVREELYKLSTGFTDTSAFAIEEDMFVHLLQGQSSCFQFKKFASNRTTSLPGNKYTLVIAEVLLGDCIGSTEMYKKKPKKGIGNFLVKEKKDSVITKNVDGPATYSVYESSQINLCYIVHFTTEAMDEQKEHMKEDALKNLPEGETVVTLAEKDLRDVSDPLTEMVQKAMSLYEGQCSLRDSYTQSIQPLKKIKDVGIVVNVKVKQKYDEKAKEMKDKSQKFTEIYAFHATSPENVASIIKNNLDPSMTKRMRYGYGCYFSEHPSFSFGYGQETMFIFKLLLIENKYTKVEPNNKGFCRELVLDDASMFKPEFVLRF